MQNAGMQNAGMQNAECRMQNAECGMQNAECRMRNAECGMRNAECGMQKGEVKKPPRSTGARRLSKFYSSAMVLASAMAFSCAAGGHSS